MAIILLKKCLDFIPIIGPLMAFMLGCYWLGVVNFQYVLDRHEIPPGQQIMRLSNNKSRNFVLEAIFEIALKIISLLLPIEWYIAARQTHSERFCGKLKWQI